MTAATVASVEERRAMVKSLGQRPGAEAVEQAKQELARIDDQLAKNIENGFYPLPPSGMTAGEWKVSQESELREAAEKEKIPYKSVIQLEELHESYKDISDDKDISDVLQDALDNKKETLDLHHRFMTHIPDTFARIVTLVTVDLSNNQLQLLPDSIAGLVNLESLKVNGNQLKTLPDSIGLMTKLKYLDVSSNLLTRLPESLSRCSSLKEMNANFNQLELISPNFGVMLVNLEKLELHLNKLRSVPASVCQLTSLKYLDLHMNKLRGLPAAIGNLSQLEYLDVSSNFSDMILLPESVGSLVSLTYCDLSFNQIKVLPVSVGRLEKLKTLKLDGNPLVVPPKEVVEHSHDAVMEYLHERWMAGIKGDLQESVSGNACSPRSKSDYNMWIPEWAENSAVGLWMGTFCGNVGTVLNSGGTGNFLQFQQHQKNDILEQQL